jgi:hypothetical protein
MRRFPHVSFYQLPVLVFVVRLVSRMKIFLFRYEGAGCHAFILFAFRPALPCCCLLSKLH